MKENTLSTQSYKGVRDFYPEDMAVQRYIFTQWRKTAEKYGFVEYDASILEPADLYRAKGAENAEMVNEQTYTFIDRGDREVTLRPEMTPTVARMIAHKRGELTFPVRWYSTPNLFRYERPQRGRLREHWQLNCDIFGSTDHSTDIEIIALANQLMLDFGATSNMFTIRINDRELMGRLYRALGVQDDLITDITRLNDRRDKITPEEYRTALTDITKDETVTEEIILMLDNSDESTDVIVGLHELGITNVVFDKSLARGFDYYTGTIFEIYDVSDENRKAVLGGGRYDNLTRMFGGEPISGIGFGMGDVRLRDFLETHNLLPKSLGKTAPTLIIIPMDSSLNLEGLKISQLAHNNNISATVDTGTRKLGKKIADAALNGAKYVMVVGENEVSSQTFTLKNLETTVEESGSLSELIAKIQA